MSEGLRPYPEYKDSGLPWLGQVPAHWDLARARYVFREVDNRSLTGDETHLSMSQKLGLVESSKIDQFSLHSESYAGGKRCNANDLVLNRLKAHLGVFAHAPMAGVVSPDYSVFRMKRDGQVRYFEFLFKTPTYIAEFRRATKGIVEGFWRLYTDDFFSIRLLFPPRREQKAILDWIDRLDLLTRRFIRNKRRLIELLNEEKQATINRAVTRGLDPHVKLKPSGSDWLGDLPEHWAIVPLKRAARLHRGYDLPDYHRITGSHPVVSSAGVIDHHSEWRVRGPGVVTGRYGSTGSVYFIDSDFWPHNTSLYVCDFCGNLPRYVFYLLQILAFGVYSDKSAVPGIDRKDLHEIQITIPPYAEQGNLVEHLDDVLAKTDRLIKNTNRQIQLI
jgi:type I restriction enzyme, S subunit